MDGRPCVFQLQLTVGNATITGALPVPPCRDVKVIVKKISLKRLHGASDHLPSVLGRVPTDPKEVLGAFVKGMVDLPHRVDMLQDDGISRVQLVGVHVKDDVYRA